MNISHFIQSRISKSKVQSQLYYAYYLGIFLPLLVISLFMILNTKKLLLNHYCAQVESDNLRVKSILFDATINFHNISTEITYDDTLNTLLQTDFTRPEDAKAIYDNHPILQDAVFNNTSISSLTIYTDNPSLSALHYFKAVDGGLQKKSWFQKASTQTTAFWQSMLVTDLWGNSSWELSLIRKIPLVNANNHAILVMTMSNNYLKNRIQNNDLSTIVTVNQDPIFFSTKRNLAGTILAVPLDYTKDYYQYVGKLSYGDQQTISSISTLNPYKTNDKIYISILDFTATDSTRAFLLNTGMILIMTVLVPFILIILFIKYFTARVKTLRQEMHKASSGDYDILDQFNGDDELSQTFSDLKIMIKNIKEKDAKMYQAKIREHQLENQQQKIEFNVLASQINPHFLFNTLETIRMMAFSSGNKEVANAIKLLGKSMHYVLENTGTHSTTLKKELDYIEVYLAIQKLRFNDRVNYTLNIQDDLNLEDYQILPLLLQPIVENAVVHSLEGIDSNGHIVVDIKAHNNSYLSINISDNGVGMTNDQLKSLVNHIQINQANNSSGFGIGLSNINKRIKLCYGSSYGMKIENRLKGGLNILLTLPLYNVLEG